MKITKIEGIPLSLPLPGAGDHKLNEVLVKIHTDEGFVGIADSGECYPDGLQDTILVMLKTWEPLLIDADPLDIALIAAKLSRYLFNDMLQVPPAVAVVDFALWDLLGKIQNKPVYQLLGGKANEKLMYNFFITGWLSKTTKEKVAEAERVVAGGCRSISIKAGPAWGNPDMVGDVANVRAIRKAIGDDIELCVDTNGGYDYTSALELGRRLEEFNLGKYEQPVPYWDIEGLANLRKNLNIPICAHESSTNIHGLLEVIKKNAADMVGLKVCWAGGISQAVKWGHIATTANLGVYCGGNNGQWEAAAQAHWFASDAAYSKLPHANLGPLFRYNTFDTTKVSIADDIVKNPMKYKDGYFYPPDGPGLGLELNEKAIFKLISKGKSPITIGK